MDLMQLYPALLLAGTGVPLSLSCFFLSLLWAALAAFCWSAYLTLSMPPEDGPGENYENGLHMYSLRDPIVICAQN